VFFFIIFIFFMVVIRKVSLHFLPSFSLSSLPRWEQNEDLWSEQRFAPIEREDMGRKCIYFFYFLHLGAIKREERKEKAPK